MIALELLVALIGPVLLFACSVATAIALGNAIDNKWRFSMRTLLTAMSVVAVLLVTVVWTVKQFSGTH
jgi:hypothetical protein